LPNARLVAQKFDTEHHEFFISGSDVPSILQQLNCYFDQPFGDPAIIPLYLMGLELPDSHKVILQGDGGDELFAGYHRYRRLKYYKTTKLLSKVLYPLKYLMPKSSSRYRSFRSLYALRQTDKAKEMALIMSQAMNDENPCNYFTREIKNELMNSNPFSRYEYFYSIFKNIDPLQRMLLTDINVLLPDLFLEKVDRATMANGLEVRVPFLDNDLASYVMALPSSYKVRGRQKKYLMKKAFKGLVPESVLFGKKQGFGVPFGYWLRTSMKDYMVEHIRASKCFTHKVNEAMNEHIEGKRDHSYILWKLLNFSMWINHNDVSIN